MKVKVSLKLRRKGVRKKEQNGRPVGFFSIISVKNFNHARYISINTLAI